MAEQMTNRARLESETYTKLHEVMKDKSGGADSIYPKLKAFSRFAQDMVTDVRASAARSPGMVLCCSIAYGVMVLFCGVMALLKTYTKLHEVMKDKSGGADSIYPKLKAFVRASAARSPGMVLCCSIAAGVMAWFCGFMALLKTLRFFHLTGGN